MEEKWLYKNLVCQTMIYEYIECAVIKVYFIHF